MQTMFWLENLDGRGFLEDTVMMMMMMKVVVAAPAAADLKEVGLENMDWIFMDHGQGPVNTLMNLQVP